MRFGFERVPTTDYKPPVDLKTGDIVWIRWLRYRRTDTPESATPSRVITVYPDGNIIHRKNGENNSEFAWAKDVIAKSNSINLAHYAYRTDPVKKIELYLKTQQ